MMPPHHTPTFTRLALVVAMLPLLTACEIPGIWPDPRTVQRESEAKAVGGACRHALRGLEDCYTLNPKASKAAVFSGWKEMDAYMRENKLEGAPSVLGKAEKPVRKRTDSDEDMRSSSNGRS